MRKLDAIPTDAPYEREVRDVRNQLDAIPIDVAYEREVRK